MREHSPDEAPPAPGNKSKDADEREQPALKAPAVRIRESPRNLKRRREWFQKRSGSDK